MRRSLQVGAYVMAVAMAKPALAQDAENYIACTKVERGQIIAALDRTERLVVTAATAIGPTPVFDRWFGEYAAENGEVVRKTLKSVAAVIRAGQITTECVNNGLGLCERDTFAFVHSDRHYHVNLCPSFFEMRTMKELNEESVAAGSGTRAGTIIHEITHFSDVADTVDICYSREDCAEMALHTPSDAVINADSYQYFVEDVTFFGVAGQ